MVPERPVLDKAETSDFHDNGADVKAHGRQNLRKKTGEILEFSKNYCHTFLQTGEKGLFSCGSWSIR